MDAPRRASRRPLRRATRDRGQGPPQADCAAVARTPRHAYVHSARPFCCAASRRQGGPHAPAGSEPHQSRRQHAHYAVQDRHRSVRPPRGQWFGSRLAATRGTFPRLHDCLGDASRRQRRGRRSLVPNEATDHHHRAGKKKEKMAEDLSSYMREHYNTLIYKEAAVRRRVIHAANRGLLEFVGEIADTARELRRKYPSSPSPDGEDRNGKPAMVHVAEGAHRSEQRHSTRVDGHRPRRPRPRQRPRAGEQGEEGGHD